MAKLPKLSPSTKSKIKEGVGDFTKKTLSNVGSAVLAGLGTGGSFNFGAADSGAEDAIESGKQTGPTGDKSKDVINALRDLQSDVNKQSAALKKNNGLLAKQTDILTKGFEALIDSNNKNIELLSQMSGGVSLGDLLKSSASSVLPSLASPAAVTAIAAISAAAAYELYKSGKEYLDMPNRPDFKKLQEKSAGLTEQEEINSAWTSRGKTMGGSKSLPSGAARDGELEPGYSGLSGQVLLNAIANPAGPSSAAPVATTASRIWTPKQEAPPAGGAVSIGRSPNAPAGAAAPAATETQKTYYDKMYNALYAAAKEKGVPNPEVIAQLGATQTSLETGYGRHMVGNNAFGIKGSGQNSVNAGTQEFVGGKMVGMKQSFRSYNNVTDSAADYIDFLQKNPRYKGVLAATNINEAITAQSKTGYATDPNYGSKLASINTKMGGGGMGGGGMSGGEMVAGRSGGQAIAGNMNGINPKLENAVNMAASEYFDATGRRIQITSGLRDSSKQAQLYQAYISGKSPYPAARPGTSKHEKGFAVDINSADAAAMDKMGILAKYGLSRPVPNDPVHIEMAGLGGGGESSGGGGGYAEKGGGEGGGGGRAPAAAAASVAPAASSGGAALSKKESSTLKQAMAVTDPHVKSRAMFQAAQDAEARGENSTALFWAADKQRQSELANLSSQPKTAASKQAATTKQAAKVETPSKAYDMSDPNQSAYSGDTGTWQKTDVTTNPDAAAYSGDTGTWTSRPGAAAEAAQPAVGYDKPFPTGTWTSRPGAAAEAAQPAVGYDKPFPTTYQTLQAERVRSNTELANDSIRVKMYDQDTEETYGANATAGRNKIAEDQAKMAAISSGEQTPAQVRGSMRQAAAGIQGTPADLGRQAIQKSQDTEPGYSGASGQTLQNAINTPAESSSDNSQSSIKPEDTSIGAQEFNRIFGNFYNATAGW